MYECILKVRATRSDCNYKLNTLHVEIEATSKNGYSGVAIPEPI